MYSSQLEEYKAKYSNTGFLMSPYDGRDYKLVDNLPLRAMQIPDNYESPIFPYVYDQGTSSMCCACSYNAIRYLQESEAHQSGINVPFSPAFTYGNRLPGEIFEGMMARSCLKKGREGSIPFSILPGFCTVQQAVALVKAREMEYLTLARPFRINSFYNCASRREIQIGIMQCKGVLIGIPLFDSFYNAKADGVIYYNPLVDRTNYGGHAVVLTGWKTLNGKLYWRLLNSWGTNWGDHGYCWLPEEYPWVEQAYCFTDDVIEVNFNDYRNLYRAYM